MNERGRHGTANNMPGVGPAWGGEAIYAIVAPGWESVNQSEKPLAASSREAEGGDVVDIPRGCAERR
jgi:hypothetical protein